MPEGHTPNKLPMWTGQYMMSHMSYDLIWDLVNRLGAGEIGRGRGVRELGKGDVKVIYWISFISYSLAMKDIW